MSTQLLQTTTTKWRNVFKFLPLFSQYHKNGLSTQIPFYTFKSIQLEQSQSLAFLENKPKVPFSKSQNGNSGSGENRNSSSKLPEMFLISALLLCHCEDAKGETVFTKKEFWFFHYFLRSIGRHGLRQGAKEDKKKRNSQPFEEDTVSQILVIIKDGDEIKELSVKVLDQLIIYAEEVIQHFEKKAKAKSTSPESESDTIPKYSERLVQWKEILHLLEQQRNSKK